MPAWSEGLLRVVAAFLLLTSGRLFTVGIPNQGTRRLQEQDVSSNRLKSQIVDGNRLKSKEIDGSNKKSIDILGGPILGKSLFTNS